MGGNPGQWAVPIGQSPFTSRSRPPVVERHPSRYGIYPASCTKLSPSQLLSPCHSWPHLDSRGNAPLFNRRTLHLVYRYLLTGGSILGDSVHLERRAGRASFWNIAVPPLSALWIPCPHDCPDSLLYGSLYRSTELCNTEHTGGAGTGFPVPKVPERYLHSSHLQPSWHSPERHESLLMK